LVDRAQKLRHKSRSIPDDGVGYTRLRADAHVECALFVCTYLNAVSAFNFFASLIEPSAVLAQCEQSTALNTLARKRHSADRPGRRQSTELLVWDAAVDEGKPISTWRAKSLASNEDSQATELLEPVAA
jgi:hypothetical protein